MTRLCSAMIRPDWVFPRGTLGKLNSFSGQTAQHGMATTNVYYGGPARRG